MSDETRGLLMDSLIFICGISIGLSMSVAYIYAGAML